MTTLNQRVTIWARGRLGRKVGHRGECWDLAEQALRAAGALTSNDLGPVTEDADYIWGTAKPTREINPGDILQFRNHVERTVTVTRVEWPDGSWNEETREETAERGHHTAIVAGMIDQTGRVATLEQNVRPRGRVVQDKHVLTRDIPTVTRVTHEQRAHPDSGAMQQATVTTRVTVTVTGQIWAYQPIARSED